MTPLWMTFIISGVVSSVGNSYFIQQADAMNRKVGKLKVPIFMLQIFRGTVRWMFVVLFLRVAKMAEKRGRGKYAGTMGIAAAMVFAVLCCTTAAEVERRRLHVVESHDLLDRPDETTPMSMLWLLPQFFLLAAHDGISGCLGQKLDETSGFSIARFSNDQVPDSIIPCLKALTKGAFGVVSFWLIWWARSARREENRVGFWTHLIKEI